LYATSLQQAPSTASLSFSGVQADTSLLPSGTLIHRDRYSLHNELHKQEWPLGVVETIWAAFDTRVAMSPVIIYELSVPDDAPEEMQDIPYTATKIFTSIGRNVHILPLRDVFSENGHSYFVFESLNGSSLLTLMFNSGRNLPEKEVIACCLQIVELLEVCARQSPPLIHGNIRPECIVKKSIDSQYALANFSIALAGGLARIVADKENAAKSPHATSTIMRGKMDVRTDLYALLGMAYYVIRGYWLSGIETSTLLPTKVLGSDLSPRLHAIFLKGLQAPLHQRYQSPSELYEDLLALSREYRRGASSPGPTVTEQSMLSFAPMVQALEREAKDFNLPDQPGENPPEQSSLLPVPEELPPLKEAYDMRNAILWFVGMLLCLLVLLGPHL
jgi:serine/threonine protein kinase